jgi:hypothetical protein
VKDTHILIIYTTIVLTEYRTNQIVVIFWIACCVLDKRTAFIFRVTYLVQVDAKGMGWKKTRSM